MVSNKCLKCKYFSGFFNIVTSSVLFPDLDSIIWCEAYYTKYCNHNYALHIHKKRTKIERYEYPIYCRLYCLNSRKHISKTEDCKDFEPKRITYIFKDILNQYNFKNFPLPKKLYKAKNDCF